jgi:RHS repeat-associated protein
MLRSDGRTLFCHQDGLGSVSALTDETGKLVERYLYEVYGAATVLDGTGALVTGSLVGNRFLYTGREWIAEAGLYDYRNRVYSAQLGRFLQSDPIRFAGGDVNIYRYVKNGVLIRVDPFGLLAFSGDFIGPITPADVRIIKGIPSNAVKYTTSSGTQFYGPPDVNWSNMAKTGRENGASISDVRANVAQGGAFDLQRNGENFYPAYSDAANVAVGYYMNSAGFTVNETKAMGYLYALRNSSNPQGHNSKLWSGGWNESNLWLTPKACGGKK